MNPSKKKLNVKKRFFPQVLPYCVLILFLLVFATITITGGPYKTKAMLYLSRLQNQEASDFIRLTETIDYYYTVFQHMIAEGYLFPGSKALCIGSISGHDVIGLRKIGVVDSIGVSEAEFRVTHRDVGHPFGDNSFDFEFIGYRSWFNWSSHPSEIVSQICRTLKVGGYLVVHIVVKDEYSYHSFINLFPCCNLIVSHEIRTPEGFAMPFLYEVILKKEQEYSSHSGAYKCMVPEYKRKLINKIEPLVIEEPRDSWNALGENENSIQYLSALVDLSFKERYIYVDIGSRDSDSSIGSWFERHYPKQNKTFEIYAVEADESFHEEHKRKAGVTLLPYAAWVRSETSIFEIDREPADIGQRWKQMVRIQPEQSSSKHKDYVNRVGKVEALDLSDWLMRSVSDRDFVVVKMDVEGAEVDLMKTLVETGAICLIDELFLECHYDRWVKKCCSGEEMLLRLERYKMEYAHCVSLFDKLRRAGCFVHQWW